LKNISKPVAVIGAGNFGIAIANILSEKCKYVLLYARTEKKAKKLRELRKHDYQQLADNIEITTDLSIIGAECDVIFPIVPSANFREMMQNLAPFLKPSHILIHGTKGFDFDIEKKIKPKLLMPRGQIFTMSEVIRQESSVIRIGCISGPNLSKEIALLKPAASVIASEFDEVIQVGYKYLKSDRFLVFGSNDLIGTELCGILKNIIAVGAGTIDGMDLGENAKALFISRGLVEMVEIGKLMGGNAEPFLGLAGIGDLMATCSGNLSRNYSVGRRLAQGEKIDDIVSSTHEIAEGIKTIKIIYEWSKISKLRVPITETLYKIIHDEITVQNAHIFLMKFPFRTEIEFLRKEVNGQDA